MSKIEEKLAYFKEWQVKIDALDKAAGPKLKELQAEYDQKANELSQELKNEIELYKAEFKKTFGLCDGERTNSLNLIEVIKAVNELS